MLLANPTHTPFSGKSATAGSTTLTTCPDTALMSHHRLSRLERISRLPRDVRDMPVVGLQGGPGSFNEIGFENVGWPKILGQDAEPQVRHLYTSGDVFEKLAAGEIDCGQVAIYNNVGGWVQETLAALQAFRQQALGKTGLRILGRYSLPIRHALMIRPDVDPSQITTIMGHPQALKQCEQNLAMLKQDRPDLSLPDTVSIIGGEGAMADPAKIAETLASETLVSDRTSTSGKDSGGDDDNTHNVLNKNTAVLGNAAIADIYGLKVIADDLQDNPNNQTTFLMLAPTQHPLPTKISLGLLAPLLKRINRGS